MSLLPHLILSDTVVVPTQPLRSLVGSTSLSLTLLATLAASRLGLFCTSPGPSPAHAALICTCTGAQWPPYAVLLGYTRQ